ncbi:phage holin family protein [Paenibacillus eucommiae]|uniref:Toxin secretion/phage lysis holin n=1 Tax=Paenibacillus eucommiae TaxID=1355755 RepID=A0ABS4IY95_9BACL|nr:phage holin family protein [Paenibacillus eucommiae]MBP1992557.1 toxin secretion/phage lysis holin [Paenibacillus eucommiae]
MDIKMVGFNLVSAAAGASGKEAAAGGIAAAIGTFATVYLGGWDAPLKILAYLMILDYATGVLGAIKTKNVNSEVMFWGGIRKGVVLLVIFMAVLLDEFAGGNAPVFRTLAIYFYAGREGLSVVENLGPLGVNLPPGIVKFLEQLKGKGDETKGEGRQ